MGEFSEFILICEWLDREGLLRRHKIIDPKTNFPWRLADTSRKLQAIVSYERRINKIPSSQIWVNFSNTPWGASSLLKSSNTPYGIKPVPHGIPAYPVDYVIKMSDADSVEPFGRWDYMHVFKSTKPHTEIGTDQPEEGFAKHLKKYDSNSISKIKDILVMRAYTPRATAMNDKIRKIYATSSKSGSMLVVKLSEFHNWAVLKIIDALKSPTEDGLQKLKHDIDNYEMISNESYEAAKNSVYKAMLSKPDRFLDVSEHDLSFKVHPNKITYLKTAGAGEYFPELHKVIENPETRLPFYVATYMVDFVFYKLVEEKKYWDFVINNAFKTNPELHRLFDEFKKGYKDEIDALVESHKKPADISNIPYGDKLVPLAKKYGVDLAKIVDVVNQKYPATANAFVYLMVSHIAKQVYDGLPSSDKGKTTWKKMWSNMLKEIGFTSFGHTKKSENMYTDRNMAVFLDFKELMLIETIPQKQSEKDMATQRTTGSSQGDYMRGIQYAAINLHKRLRNSEPNYWEPIVLEAIKLVSIMQNHSDKKNDNYYISLNTITSIADRIRRDLLSYKIDLNRPWAASLKKTLHYFFSVIASLKGAAPAPEKTRIKPYQPKRWTGSDMII
jgi:hypothetical protein